MTPLNRSRLVLTLGLLMGALSGCSSRSVTGDYLASAPGAIDWLQLTQTPDQHLAGSLTRMTYNPQGVMQRGVIQISGVVDDDELALMVKPEGFLTQEFAMQARRQGSSIQIIWPGNTPKIETLFPSTITDYGSHLADLEQQRQHQASIAATEKANQDRVNEEIANAERLKRQEQARVAEIEQQDRDRRAAQAAEAARAEQQQAAVENQAQQYAMNLSQNVDNANLRTDNAIENIKNQYLSKVNHAQGELNHIKDLENGTAPDRHRAVAQIAQNIDALADSFETQFTTLRDSTVTVDDQRHTAFENSDQFKNWRLACTDPAVRNSSAAKPSDETCHHLLDAQQKALNRAGLILKKLDSLHVFVQHQEAVVHGMAEQGRALLPSTT